MTDEEIIKALNTATNIDGLQICCIDYENNPKNATYLSIKSDIVDLINRQQAEIECLQETIFKKEDLMQMLFTQKQGYYDELVSAKAEIERLKPLEENFDKLLYMLNAVDMGQSVLEEQKHTIRTEAIKEFAEQLKEYFREKAIETFGDMADSVEYLTIDTEQTEIDIDNLVKEMVGEHNAETTV